MGMKKFSDFLRKGGLPRLHTIGFCGNAINDEGIMDFVGAVKVTSRPIKVIDFGGNDFSEQGSQTLLDLVKSAPTLHSVGLSMLDNSASANEIRNIVSELVRLKDVVWCRDFYLAMIVPFAVFSWNSPTNLYSPGFRDLMFIFDFLFPPIIFSICRS